jgi:galactokinase
VTIALGRRPDRQARCLSTEQFGDVQVDLGHLRPASLPSWARYPIGVLWAFERFTRTQVAGVDIVIDSTVPSGAGLASSAALEASVAVAVDDVCRAGLALSDLASICHAAESEFVGVPVGLLDQLAVLGGQAGQGLLIDFRSLAVELLPMAIGPLIVVDTHVRHNNADGAYRARRRSCEQAAERLGVADLREATATDVAVGLDGELQRRARHVVNENGRVLEAARRLRTGAEIGDLLTESHASLRDEYEVSCVELDAVVEEALAAGASGARLTGAGFGGCVIALGVDAGALDEGLQRRFGGSGLRQPTAFPVLASSGAGRVG